jgi:hypothetical protein
MAAASGDVGTIRRWRRHPAMAAPSGDHNTIP